MSENRPDRQGKDAVPPAEGVDAAGRIDIGAMCRQFIERLEISGVVISIVDLGGRRSTVAATDVVAARWDEIELEVGAGPLRDAVTTASPQVIPDVHASAVNPLVASHFDELGVRAVFAFPLTLGSATVGVAGLYRTTPGELSAEDVRTASRIARSLAGPAVRTALRLAAHDLAGSREDVTDTRHAPELRRDVHQATGMISGQLDVTMTEAFARLRAHAVASERTIMAIARDVVGGAITLVHLD